MRKPKKKPADHDHPWKLIFTYFFEEAILFIQPALHDLIDWEKGVEFLEQELHEAIKTRFRSAKICDKLAKVYLKNGKEYFLLVHIEIESAPRAIFGKRFYWYRVLIFDKHKSENIYSLVVYTGKKSRNQVSKYEFRFLDNRMSFEFPALKIWEMDEKELEQSDNIFALFVLAQKYANASRDDMGKRLSFRKHLFALSEKKKITRQKIFQCLIFVKYLTAMPKDLEIEYQEFENKQLKIKTKDMWLTLEDVKRYDSIVEDLQGVSLQKMLREATEKAEKAEKAEKVAKKAAKKAAREAAREAAKEAAKAASLKTVLKCHFDLGMDLKSISKIVDMTQKEIKAVIAEEEKKRKNSAAE